MSKFKVGDLVYCLPLTHKISKITKVNEDNDVFLNKAGWFKNTGLNVNGMPVILHATQENYELLSKLYPNVVFEPPPKRKEPKEIIRAMLESGWEYVPCYTGETEKVLKSNHKKELIVGIKNNYFDSWAGGGNKFAVPFDPKTGKTIIDFVDGEVVLGD
ncbi:MULTISPECIES: hypothetical protein [unclassified Moraxella]|uniref:hypothetical protein n=1 Tax=unclassified Moraxella TaxID=2685852 RepID=UPI002B402CCD|nr:MULTISPECIES: hypothetical protein [unclassified Moraxella]